MIELCLRAWVAATQRLGSALDERGQTTAEYALIVVAAAVIGAMVIAWATSTGKLSSLFNAVISRVQESVTG